ncbi:MAG: hypothetical protein HYT28_02905 [Parcubacteria group bacterium]|nr:hypothetical protein [Parcubacteria group bacterium]
MSKHKKQSSFSFGAPDFFEAEDKLLPYNLRKRKIRRARQESNEPEPKLRFSYNKKRTKEAMLAIMKSFEKETHLFRFVFINDAPQHKYYPKEVVKGSFEHLLFLFLGTLLVYRSVSDQGFKQAVLLENKFPWLFSKEILEKTLEDVIAAMKAIGFIHPWEVARSWYGTARTLFSEYEGDPIRLLVEIKSVDAFLKLKRKKGGNRFPGYGPKLFSLLVLFYQELGVPESFLVKEAFPVDLHVQRVFLSLGLISFNTRLVDSVKLAEYIRKKLSRLCEVEHIPVIELSHALWFLGNRLCGKCQNTSYMHLRCPLYNMCGGAFSSEPYRLEGKWDNQLPRKPKGGHHNQEYLPLLLEVFGLEEETERMER